MIQFFKQISKLRSNIYAGIQDQSNKQHISFLRQLQKDSKENKSLEIPLKDLKTVVFDLETTGFYPEKGDHILSIGAVKMTGDKIEDDYFYSLVKSELPLSKEISLLTNIQENQLKTAPEAKDVFIQFLKYTNTRILVAHHSQHERSFMQKMSRDTMRIGFQQRIIDTSFLAFLQNTTTKSQPLDDICNQLGIKIENRHNALGDAQMTARIWSLYMNKAILLGFGSLLEIYEYLAKLK
ncbi:MAG: exonuclease domain-containing protein [Bacillota bacterium]|nr:exonuclease domain-containing protein [Bacillota bacterium]